MAAIYSSWTAILRASKVVSTRRRRRAFAHRAANPRGFDGEHDVVCHNVDYYGFVAENGSDALLSFVARLPKSFPRSGRFGDLDVRRLTYSVEASPDGNKELVLRQQSILTEMDEDEQEYPLVLARDVQEFVMEFWDSRVNDWVDEWQTNQLPKLIKLTLSLRRSDGRASKPWRKSPISPRQHAPAAFQTPMRRRDNPVPARRRPARPVLQAPGRRHPEARLSQWPGRPPCLCPRRYAPLNNRAMRIRRHPFASMYDRDDHVLMLSVLAGGFAYS